jgi:PadR family transcriptional regulator PadR
MARRPSRQTASVLNALSRDPPSWRYGYELGKEVELQAGTLYPILMRLCDRGLLEASWEADPPMGRPRRHMYRITAAGERAASSPSG